MILALKRDRDRKRDVKDRARRFQKCNAQNVQLKPNMKQCFRKFLQFTNDNCTFAFCQGLNNGRRIQVIETVEGEKQRERRGNGLSSEAVLKPQYTFITL